MAALLDLLVTMVGNLLTTFSKLLVKSWAPPRAHRLSTVPNQGMVERNNRVVIDSMKRRLERHDKNWPEHLPFVMLAYNCLPHSKTGLTPYLVFHGREAPLPNFTDTSVDSLRSKSIQEYTEKLKGQVKIVHEAARAKTQETIKKEVESYNRKAKHTPLMVGEKVFSRVPDGRRKKLDSRWHGPLEVTRRRSSVSGQPGTTYECTDGDGKISVKNYEQLKRTNVDQPLFHRDSSYLH